MSVLIRVIFSTSLFLITKVVFSQQVESGNVINCTTNMPTSVTTSSVQKYNCTNGGQVLRHKSTVGNGIETDKNPNINLWVSSKFQVASNDLGQLAWNVVMGYPSVDNTNSNKNPSSFLNTGCANYFESSENEKGSWRAPTQKELILIWILNEKLANKLSTNKKYWSATEVDNTWAWGLASDGAIFGASKGVTIYVRCIKDLP